MRLHPYIFKIKIHGKIEYHQGTIIGVFNTRPTAILEVRINTNFSGKNAEDQSIEKYFETLEIVEPKKTAS